MRRITKISNKNILICIGLYCGALASCQTVPVYKEYRLGKDLSRYFGSCKEGGEALMRLETGGNVEGELNMEWVSQKTSSWRALAYDSFGRTILTIDYLSGKSIKAGGKLSGVIPQIGLSKSENLTVGGNQIPFSPKELPCFWNYTFPIEWLDNPASVREHDKETNIKIRDRSRDISLTVIRNGRNVHRICARVKWYRFLGIISNEVNICFDGSQGYGSITGYKDYELKWYAKDGE